MHAKKILVVLAAAVLFASCELSINSDIEVPDGSTVTEDMATVNGDVEVGARVEAESADFRTVNGSVEIGEGSKVGALGTVNGSIKVDAEARVGRAATVNGRIVFGRGAQAAGDLSTTNGSIRVEPGALVGGNVESVNGLLEFRGAHIRGSVENYNGGIRVLEGAVIEGGLAVRRPDDSSSLEHTPVVIIGPGSRVNGPLVFEREVRLFVHETAHVGSVTGAEAVRYAGDEPPAT